MARLPFNPNLSHYTIETLDQGMDVPGFLALRKIGETQDIDLWLAAVKTGKSQHFVGLYLPPDDEDTQDLLRQRLTEASAKAGLSETEWLPVSPEILPKKIRRGLKPEEVPLELDLYLTKTFHRASAPQSRSRDLQAAMAHSQTQLSIEPVPDDPEEKVFVQIRNANQELAHQLSWLESFIGGPVYIPILQADLHHPEAGLQIFTNHKDTDNPLTTFICFSSLERLAKAKLEKKYTYAPISGFDAASLVLSGEAEVLAVDLYPQGVTCPAALLRAWLAAGHALQENPEFGAAPILPYLMEETAEEFPVNEQLLDLIEEEFHDQFCSQVVSFQGVRYSLEGVQENGRQLLFAGYPEGTEAEEAPIFYLPFSSVATKYPQQLRRAMKALNQTVRDQPLQIGNVELLVRGVEMDASGLTFVVRDQARQVKRIPFSDVNWSQPETAEPELVPTRQL